MQTKSQTIRKEGYWEKLFIFTCIWIKGKPLPGDLPSLMAKFGIFTTFMAETFQADNICDKMNTSPLWRDKPSGKYSQGFLQYSLTEDKLTIQENPKKKKTHPKITAQTRK